MMGLPAKTPAVLSLNGQPQVTLRVRQDGEHFNETLEQMQHTDPPIRVGTPTLVLMNFLGAVVRLRLSDGRVILGRFHCFDKHQNVILKDAREFAPTGGTWSKHHKDKDALTALETARDEAEEARFATRVLPGGSRALGMTLVPGKHIVYMKVQC